MPGLNAAGPTMRWSLRAKMLAILGVVTVFAVMASLVLIYGIRQANMHLEQASSAQKRLELLMLLSGRVTDYGLAAIVSLQSPDVDRLDDGRAHVQAVLGAIDGAISNHVALQASQKAMNAAATQSLGLARMRAQFDILDRQIVQLKSAGGPVAEMTDRARQSLDAFAVSFSPHLAQAVEDGRKEAQFARADMLKLRDRLTVFAIVWVIGAATMVVVLYLTTVRSVLQRIRQAALGAGAIASGQLGTRLATAGHDELTLLMVKFNRMAQNLSRREARLMSAQRDLQKTIDARTSDLSDANQRLTDIDLNRRRFFSDVSHELRTPLTVILGESEITLRQKKGKLPQTVRKSLETILARAQNLRRRVDDLLRVARSESGELNLHFETIDMKTVVDEAIGELHGLARKHGVMIEMATVRSPLNISGDKEWLRQVAGGLIANAIKYSQPGGQITVSGSLDDLHVVVDFADQGCGIDSADLARVFDRFYRGQQHGFAEEDGHGIGLALAKWVIESHHGEIEIFSPSPAPDASADSSPSSPGTLVRLKIPAVK